MLPVVKEAPDQRNIFGSWITKEAWKKTLSNFLVNTAPTDGLVFLGVWTSEDTEMTKSAFLKCAVLIL